MSSSINVVVVVVMRSSKCKLVEILATNNTSSDDLLSVRLYQMVFSKENAMENVFIQKLPVTLPCVATPLVL